MSSIMNAAVVSRLKLKVRSRMISAMKSGVGTRSRNDGLAAYIDLDYSEFNQRQVYDPATQQVLIQDGVDGSFWKISVDSLIKKGGVVIETDGNKFRFEQPDGTFSPWIDPTGPEGPMGPPGDAPLYGSRASASVATIASGRNYILVSGYSTPGDCEPVVYSRVAMQPTHAGKFRSADRFLPNGSVDAANGGWWSLSLTGDQNVKWWGAKNDGSDIAAALQSLADALRDFGGTIVFPAGGIWGISRQVLISTRMPINLKGSMGVGLQGPNFGSYIRPLNDISGSLIKYVHDTPAQRGSSLCGWVDGLAFLDDSNLGASTIDGRRNYTMDAALDLADFNWTSVRNCSFTYIAGSAIKTRYCVQTNIFNNQIHYCGTASNPALHISNDNVGSGYLSQSIVVSHNKIEVCFGSPYLQIDTGNYDISLVENGFESYPAEPNSCMYYVSSAGTNTLVLGNSFKGNTQTAVTLNSAVHGKIIGNHFEGITSNNIVSDSNCIGAIIKDNTFFDAAISGGAACIDVSGYQDCVEGNNLYAVSGIRLNGPFQRADGNSIYNAAGSALVLINLTSNSVASEASHNTITSSSLSGNTGIAASAENQSVSNNTISNQLVGISIGSVSGVLASANTITLCPTPLSIGATSPIVQDNRGFRTRNKGASVLLNGTTSVVVNHGIDVTPRIQDISISPGGTLGGATTYWITNITATQFTINVNANPGTNVTFGWDICALTGS